MELMYNIYDTNRRDTAVYEDARTGKLEEVLHNSVVFSASPSRTANYAAIKSLCGKLLAQIWRDDNGNIVNKEV